MAARRNCEAGDCQQQTHDRLFLVSSCIHCHGHPEICAVTGSGWAEVFPSAVPAVWAGDLSGRRELIVVEKEQALGNVKKRRNVSASIPIPCPSKK